MKWLKIVYWITAVYDLVLGMAFLFSANLLFERFEVTPPNHLGYVQFPALLLIVFAAMYGRIATDPVRFRVLMPYGIGLKAAYAGVVFYHQAAAGVPGMWLPFAYIDLVFMFLFVLGWRMTKPG